MLPRATALLSVLALLAAGCGDGGESSRVPPPARFGEGPAAALVSVERIRSQLAVASDLAAIGRRQPALAHLREAARRWDAVAMRVRSGDPVLGREVSAAFALVATTLRGATAFDPVRDRLAPLQGQLLGGVREELVPDKVARLDPGVNAAALRRLLAEAERRYAAGGAPALEDAFGLIDRSQAVARDVAADLGPRRDAVVEGLKDLRGAAFPDGVALPARPADSAEVRRRIAAIQTALRARFDL